VGPKAVMDILEERKVSFLLKHQIIQPVSLSQYQLHYPVCLCKPLSLPKYKITLHARRVSFSLANFQEKIPI
jgi:hypothetical protein